MGETSVRSVARTAGLHEATVRKALAGEVSPEIRTVARLEEALGARLHPKYRTASGMPLGSGI